MDSQQVHIFPTAFVMTPSQISPRYTWAIPGVSSCPVWAVLGSCQVYLGFLDRSLTWCDGDRMTKINARDSRLLAWLDAVRIADTEAISWAMGRAAGRAVPVARRLAQRWVKRMEEMGEVQRTDTYYPGLLIRPAGIRGPWVTSTMNHDRLAAQVAGRLLDSMTDIQIDDDEGRRADFIASSVWGRVAYEVELSPKNPKRYKQILRVYAGRTATGGDLEKVVWLCTPTTARRLSELVAKMPPSAVAGKIVVAEVLSESGRLVADLPQGVAA